MCNTALKAWPPTFTMQIAFLSASKYLRFHFADWYLRYQISVYKSSWYEFYGNVEGVSNQMHAYMATGC
jgi:hypothetical protein